ncbi:MAG: extracellular solute-binding protein [Propionicimonas sp.]
MRRGHQARWRRSVLAGALAAVVVTGCAGVPAPEPTPDPNRFEEHGPIMFAAPDDSPGWAAAVTEWNRANPTQPVTLRALSTNPDQRYTALSDAAKAGRGDYTVMALDQDWVAEFAANDWVTELPADAFGTDALLGSVAAAGTYEGRRYGFGVSADAGVLYYRKDLLDRAGVKAPTTWNQLTAACSAVRARQLGMNCLGMALASTDDRTGSLAQAIYSAQGSLVDDTGAVVVTSPAATTGVNWLSTAVANGTVPKSALTWHDDQAVQAFADGDVVFLQSGTVAWRAAQAATNASRVSGKIAVGRLPGAAAAGVPVSSGYQLALSAKGRNQGTAADFMRWLAGDQAQRLLLSEGSLAPVLASLYTDAQLKPQPQFMVFADAIKASRPLPQTAKFAQFSKDVSEGLSPVLTGQTTAAEALPKLQQKLSDLLK